MITYGIKRSPTGRLWLKRWVKMRRFSRNERWINTYRKYRRKWWWDENMWNRRHGVSQSSD